VAIVTGALMAKEVRTGRRSEPRQPTPHVARKRKLKRHLILESAVRAFAARGFYGTSMDDIAEELHLTRGSVYYYFRDKEEILALCHLAALEAVLEAAERVRRAGLPPDETLRRLVVEHVRIQVDKFHGTALALEFDALQPTARAAVVAARDRYERTLREILAAGIAAGLFRPVDPKLAAFAIFGAINWIGRWYRATGPSTPDEIGAGFADVFLDGLRVRPSGGAARR
jgi:AcrR family transcriptional regulator